MRRTWQEIAREIAQKKGFTWNREERETPPPPPELAAAPLKPTEPPPPVEALASLTARLLAPLEAHTPGVRAVYERLHSDAREEVYRRGYSPKVSTVVFFGIGELIAAELDMSRSHFYRCLRELRRAGLVYQRGRRVDWHRGRNCDGTVFEVAMTPRRPGALTLVKGTLEDKRAWYQAFPSDLAERVRDGRTAFVRARELRMRQSKGRTEGSTQAREANPVETLSSGSLNSQLMTVSFAAPELYTWRNAVLDVQNAPRESVQRRLLVDSAARQIAAVLRDQDWLDWHRLMLWQALRCSLGGRDWFAELIRALAIAVADAPECRTRPGVIYRKQLDELGILEELRRTPRNRIAALGA